MNSWPSICFRALRDLTESAPTSSMVADDSVVGSIDKGNGSRTNHNTVATNPLAKINLPHTNEKGMKVTRKQLAEGRYLPIL